MRESLKNPKRGTVTERDFHIQNVNCHDVILRSRKVTDCPEHALLTNIFVANIRRLWLNFTQTGNVNNGQVIYR